MSDPDDAIFTTRAGIDHACSEKLGRGLHEIGAPLPIGHAVLTLAWMEAFVDCGERLAESLAKGLGSLGMA